MCEVGSREDARTRRARRWRVRRGRREKYVYDSPSRRFHLKRLGFISGASRGKEWDEMSYRAVLQVNPESVQDLEVSARRRLDEAAFLLMDGQHRQLNLPGGSFRRDAGRLRRRAEPEGALIAAPSHEVCCARHHAARGAHTGKREQAACRLREAQFARIGRPGHRPRAYGRRQRPGRSREVGAPS